MILSKGFYNSNNGKSLEGKVSPSQLRWYGVENDLIKAYSKADDELKAFTGHTENWDEANTKIKNELFNAKVEAQNAIEKRLEELSK